MCSSPVCSSPVDSCRATTLPPGPRREPHAGGVRSGPSISRQIKVWSAAEKEAEKHRRKDMKKKKQNQGGGSGAGAGTGGGLDWLQSVGFEDEYLQQAREIENLLCYITPLVSDCCCPWLSPSSIQGVHSRERQSVHLSKLRSSAQDVEHVDRCLFSGQGGSVASVLSAAQPSARSVSTRLVR